MYILQLDNMEKSAQSYFCRLPFNKSGDYVAMKTRIDVECVCQTCSLVFTLHGIDHYIADVGAGYDIGNLQCPNCLEKGLKFDLLRVKDNGFVEYHRQRVKSVKIKMLGGGTAVP